MGPLEIGLLAAVELPGCKLAEQNVRVFRFGQDAITDDLGSRRDKR